MSAGTYKIECEQGADFTLNLTWRDGTGAVLNLTGYTARMDVRTSKDAATALVSATTENGRITLGGAEGTVQILIPASVTAGFAPGQYVYDLKLISATGRATRLIEGFFIVDGQVTQ